MSGAWPGINTISICRVVKVWALKISLAEAPTPLLFASACAMLATRSFLEHWLNRSADTSVINNNLIFITTFEKLKKQLALQCCLKKYTDKITRQL